MALVPCRECEKSISTEALFCPGCGVPEPARDFLSQKQTQSLVDVGDIQPANQLQARITVREADIEIDCEVFQHVRKCRVRIKVDDEAEYFLIKRQVSKDKIIPELFGRLSKIRWARRAVREENDLLGRRDAIRKLAFVDDLFVGESTSSAVKRLKLVLGQSLFTKLLKKYNEGL